MGKESSELNVLAIFFGILAMIVGIGIFGVGIIESKPIASVEFMVGPFAIGLGIFLVCFRNRLFEL